MAGKDGEYRIVKTTKRERGGQMEMGLDGADEILVDRRQLLLCCSCPSLPSIVRFVDATHIHLAQGR